MAVQIITFQLCSNPSTYQDFIVDDSVVLSGHTIFADYQCWESTGNVGAGPTGIVIFSGYTGCSQCNSTYNTWDFDNCDPMGADQQFSFPNSEIYEYFYTTGATISYSEECYTFTPVYTAGTGSTIPAFTVQTLKNNGLFYLDCPTCQAGPSPTPTPTPSITPTPTPVCISGQTDGPSWYYTDCCGNYQSGSLFPSGVCVNVAYPYSGIAIFTGQICSPVCPSVTPTVTPTMTSTPSVTSTPSITVTPSVTPTKSVTPTPSITPTPSSTMGSTPSVTPSVTPTITPTSSVTPSLTPTSSVTPSLTPTMTVTPTPSSIPTGCSQYTFTLQEIYFLNQAGPYNISGVTTGGTIVSIATGITNAQLLTGYTTLVCYSITGGTIQSTGACTNSVEYLVATPTPQPSPSPTPSKTPTPTVTKTPTPTKTPTVTSSITPTLSVTPTRTPSITPTPSSSLPNVTQSVTPTTSVTPSVTPTPSISITPSPTPSSITISLVYQHQKLNSCSRTFGNIQKNGTTFYTWNTPFPVSTYSGTTTAHVGDLIDLSMDALGITSGCTALGYGCSVVGYSIVRNGVTVQTNTESSCGTGSINDTYLIPNSTTSLIIYITSDVTT
jgi:hypothetical protein